MNRSALLAAVFVFLNFLAVGGPCLATDILPSTQWADIGGQATVLRGSVLMKEGQTSISQELLEKEIARGFKARGVYRTRLRYWAEGVAVWSEEFIRSEIGRRRGDGRYRRRKNPIPQLGGVHLSLREQRSHAINF